MVDRFRRVDITYATRKLARYNAAPRVVHWEAAKHVFGYLNKHPKLALPLDPTPLKSEPGVPMLGAINSRLYQYNSSVIVLETFWTLVSIMTMTLR